MNTLLGELGAFNDIQYPRHRLAFKLRKLQTSFLLQHQDLNTLQEIMHSTGIQPLPVDDEMSETQIRSLFAEVFTSIKSSRSGISQPQVQEAHGTCLNWFLMAFHVDQLTNHSKAAVGKMKIALTLLCGSKPADKAKYLFSVLAKNGTLGQDGIQYFCETVQIIADCLNEIVYSDESSINRAMSECLYFVRDHDDIEDEEEDGGLQRPWLSCFELIKVFTADPPLNFLSWMELWFSLPQMEKSIHNVKCSVCNKKSIVGFRYQCAECSNYHMCQMCFLKGRTSESHALEHKVFECTSYSKSLKNLFSKSNQPKDSRVMDDIREPPALRLGGDYHDGSTSSLHRLSYVGESPMLSHIRSPSSTPEPSQRPHELRIGSSRNSLVNPPTSSSNGSMRNSTSIDSTGMITGGMHRLSFCSTTSSDSNDGIRGSFEGSISPMGMVVQAIGEQGNRKQAPIISSLKKSSVSNAPAFHHSLQKLSHGSPIRKSLTPTHSATGRRNTVPDKLLSKTASEGMLLRDTSDEFTVLNRKLSYEVDQILKDMEPEISPVSVLNNDQEDNETLDLFNQLLNTEENELKERLENAEQKKSKLSTDLDIFLNQIQDMHNGFTALKQTSNNRKTTITHHQLHLECHHERGNSLDMLEKPNSTSRSPNHPITHSRHTSIVW